MAREIVITSVPRGVKLGRTGFQVAMQTAGLRDDVATVLEKMAGYRHLPAGSGANPVSYFHRLARTVAGPLNVVGRIVDSGVDFSNRSNKLAHMVVLEPTDLGMVAGSSPATLLTSVEGRLATSWPGGPEERQQGFSLAGIPAAVPAPCGTWQQVMGDAGWAGVIADRAIGNQPTLLIGPDSSPASCSRMLALFREALAIVPPAKRWSVTFDTTSLSPEGVLWRGTYAGSPESQAAQPGLLVIDLTNPQPIPANMAVGDLVQMARTGQGPASAVPAGSTTLQSDQSGPAAEGSRAPIPRSAMPVAAGGRPALPPPGSATGGPAVGGTFPPRLSRLVLWLTLGILLPLLLAGVGTLVLGISVWPSLQSAKALKEVQRWAANNGKESKEPTIPTYQTLLRAAGPGRDQSVQSVQSEVAEFLNAALASKALTADDVKDADAVRELFHAVLAIKAESGMVNSANLLLLKVAGNPQAAELLAAFHPGAFETFQELSKWAKCWNELVRLANANEADRNGRHLDKELWDRIVEAAKETTPDKDFADANQEAFLRNLGPNDLTSLEKLASVLAGVTPANPVARAVNNAGNENPEKKSTEESAAAPPPPDKAAEAFANWRPKLEEYRKSGEAAWPRPVDPSQSLESVALVPDLDVEVVVGTTPGFTPKAVKDGEKRVWKVMLEGKCLAVVDLSDDSDLRFSRGEVADEVWQKYEPFLKYMPIGFHRPDKPIGEEDWLVLGKQNQEHMLESNPTLYDLLWNENLADPNDPTVSLVLNPPLSLSASDQIRWQPREVVREGPLTVGAVPISANEISLEITARIGDRNYTLHEPLEVDVVGQKVRRIKASWRERPSRLEPFPKNNANEPTVLGFKDGKLEAVGKPGVLANLSTNLPLIIKALLEDAYRDRTVNANACKSLLTKWKPSWEKSSSSVLDLRDELEAYLGSEIGPFVAPRFAKYEAAAPSPGKDPGVFSEMEPEKKKDETQEIFNKRKKDWEERPKDHAARKKHWDDWREKGLTPIRNQLKEPAELRTFIAESTPKGEPSEDPEPYVSAAHVLLGLDGLVVAKVNRNELEALLKRIPVGALFEGEVRYDWTVPGLEQPVTTVAARLGPSALQLNQSDARDPPNPRR